MAVLTQSFWFFVKVILISVLSFGFWSEDLGEISVRVAATGRSGRLSSEGELLPQN